MFSTAQQLSCYKEIYILVSFSFWAALFGCFFFLWQSIIHLPAFHFFSYLSPSHPTRLHLSLFPFLFACTNFFHYLSIALMVYQSVSLSLTHVPICLSLFSRTHNYSISVLFNQSYPSLSRFIQLSPLVDHWLYTISCIFSPFIYSIKKQRYS